MRHGPEWALHRRARLVCEAAATSKLPGRFEAWEQEGLLPVLAGDPALRFLSTVSAVAPENFAALLDLMRDERWGGIEPVVVLTSEAENELQVPLVEAGFRRTADRLMGVRALDEPFPATAHGPDVVVAPDVEIFLDVLLAGYEVDGPVAALIRAEHRHPSVQRFLALRNGVPSAAAAMTVHETVAVLGGASTLPDHRGMGAQSALLHHRLRAAADAGCRTVVATAAPDGTSARNLARAGFTAHRRRAWTR
jgi:GNAT superfamily N-acetyltransferase